MVSGVASKSTRRWTDGICLRCGAATRSFDDPVRLQDIHRQVAGLSRDYTTTFGGRAVPEHGIEAIEAI